MSFLEDPETWLLPHLDGPEDRSLGNAARMPCAAVVPLPLRREHLRDRETLLRLVRTVLRGQIGAMWLIPPYFMVQSVDDPWLDVNLRAIAMAASVSGRAAPLAADLRVPFDLVSRGDLPYLAARYRAALPPGARLILTVCDLGADLDAADIARYLAGVIAFREAGLPPIVDRASELTIAAVAVGASGAILGNCRYRTAAARPRWTNPWYVKVKLRYLTASRCDRLDISRARSRQRGRHAIPACRDSSCRALDQSKEKDEMREVRLHNAHWLRLEAAHAADLGPARLADEWRRLGLRRPGLWAQALDDVMLLSKDA